MSSTYAILCLSHDPATLHGEYTTPEAAETAIRNGIDGHPHCDLMIGRFSYPLVELGCPPSRDRKVQQRCYHGTTVWTDSDWLRLLAAAYQSTDPAVLAAVKAGHHGCLPWERLRRLRVELGFELKEEQP
ncbi:hypothetical protein [Streptomyces sp. YIM S03343]